MTSSLRNARATLVLALCISLACGQATQCSPSHAQPKLRFVAQLSVNGCAIFVHDTGAKDGLHLAVEPLMCVTQSLSNLIPSYDSVIQLVYWSVPVTLRDDAILREVQNQLRHLSPKSVKFATVLDISVSADKSSLIQVLGFYWSPDESSGNLRIWSRNNESEWSFSGFSTQVLQNLSAVAVIEADGSIQRHSYSLMMQNHNLIDPNIHASRYSDFPTCDQLPFVRSIEVTNCSVRVHKRLNIRGHFLIEPLLCLNITSFTEESVMHDYSRDMYYLNLDVVLQDDVTLNAVKTNLINLSPLNVSFMRLWRAEIAVPLVLSSRLQIGPLIVSGDWKSGQVRVYCKTVGDCHDLRSAVIKDQLDLWRHVRWLVTSLFSTDDTRLCKSFTIKYLNQDKNAPLNRTESQITKPVNCSESQLTPCQLQVTRGGRNFLVIQQRLTGGVSFQRGWAEYETGFGDGTDFWIGLSTIHSLSINGVTLRVEMKLMNGSELHHQEYSEFKVGDASTNYTMTYGGIIVGRSSDSYDALAFHNGMQFSTVDRDNDKWTRGSCSTGSELGGNGGWWFNYCIACNPNHVYGSEYTWFLSSIQWQPYREIRLMLQI